MIINSDALHGIGRYLRDRGGNFGMLTALAIPAAIAVAGVAVDVSNMTLARSQLQQATDAAALATASALANGDIDVTAATQFAKDFVAGQMANYLASNSIVGTTIKDATTVTPTSTANGATGKIYTVAVNSSFSMPVNGMTRILGWSNVGIAAGSSTTSSTETKNALSMYLVLDRSGSMDETTDTVNAQQPTTTTCTQTNSRGVCTKTKTTTNYYTKMQSLKIAVQNLTAQLTKADPNSQYVRTGADSFNSQAQTPSPMAWGTSDVSAYVNALSSTGTTSSTAAFTAAYTALTTKTPKSEDQYHAEKNGQTPTKYIIFMTDGANNVGNADKDTRDQCDNARKDGIQVYTVALMAPQQGQDLLNYCATRSSTSSDPTYFKAENSDDLVAAFKAIGEKAAAQLTLLTR